MPQRHAASIHRVRPRIAVSRISYPRSDEAGFTIIEVLIGMLLMTIVMLGTMAIQVTNMQQATGLRQSSAAARLAQATLQRLQASSRANLIETGGAWITASAADGASLLQNVGPQGSGTGPYTVEQLIEAAGTGLMVSVRVSWWTAQPGGNPGQPRRLALSTRRYR